MYNQQLVEKSNRIQQYKQEPNACQIPTISNFIPHATAFLDPYYHPAMLQMLILDRVKTAVCHLFVCAFRAITNSWRRYITHQFMANRSHPSFFTGLTSPGPDNARTLHFQDVASPQQPWNTPSQPSDTKSFVFPSKPNSLFGVVSILNKMNDPPMNTPQIYTHRRSLGYSIPSCPQNSGTLLYIRAPRLWHTHHVCMWVPTHHNRHKTFNSKAASFSFNQKNRNLHSQVVYPKTKHPFAKQHTNTYTIILDHTSLLQL